MPREFHSGNFSVVMASGMVLLSPDEAMLVAGYRAVKQQQAGTLFVEFDKGFMVKCQIRPDYGNAKLFNIALGVVDG